MATNYNPRLVTDGLVLCLDAGNQKSLNIPTQADHGYADWYCLVSGTVTYSIVNSTGGVIYERNGSTITTVVTASGPQSGTFSIIAGRFYYGSVPINLVVEDQHHYIIPLTMMGTQFWNVVVRNNPSTYYVYSPYQAATVNFYDNTVGGLTGTPTSTLSLSAGQSGTFTSNNLTNHWISSTAPIIASTTQNGVDKTILSPMSTYVYQRYQNYINTTNNTTPTNNNAYVTYDSTYKVMNMSIADGAGGDCAQGLGLEYLSDTYSWGNVLSDYTIVFPYTATVVTSYWNGSTWVVWDTHSNIAGSITNPPRITRDGTNGPGVEASSLSGAVTNMASGATLWKWEGTAPFYLAINDNADDEFSVLGWLSARNTTPRSSNIITDISGNGNNGTLFGTPSFTSSPGYFDITSDSTYIRLSSYNHRTNDFTYSMWVRFDAFDSYNTLFENGSWTDTLLFRVQSRTSIAVYIEGALRGTFTWNPSTGIWYNVVYTRLGSTNTLYVNGTQSGSTFTDQTDINIANAYTILMRSQHATSQFTNGQISQYSMYNKALTPQEIQQNFNATRSRYSI